MRVRRVTNSTEFRAALEYGPSDVLPLWFADAERDWLARTVDRDLASLAPLCEQSYPSTQVTGGADDWVLVTAADLTALAGRYAEITGRPVVRDLAVEPSDRPPRSITWFCSLEENDMATALHALSGNLKVRFGRLPRLAALTAETVARLTWLLAKQLVPARPEPSTTTLVTKEPAGTRPAGSLVVVGPDLPVQGVVDRLNEVRGTLLIDVHSRPHCGILTVVDGEVGMCGRAVPETPGRCVDGVACYFGEAPRAVLEELQAQRVYFNGCTTGGVGGRRRDFLPRSVMVCHAVLRGAARELVANVHVGFYGETDIHWFMVASALGKTAAEAVEVVELSRAATGRETVRTALAFGDALSAPWPMHGVSVGEVEVEPEVTRVRWSRRERVLAARLTDPNWARLAATDRLHVRCDHPALVRVSVIEDPWEQGTLLFAVLGGDESPGGDPSVELRALPEPVDRALTGALAGAIRQVRWLATAPAFHRALATAPQQLEAELITLQKVVTSRDNTLHLPELVETLRKAEGRAAGAFDNAVVDEALLRSQSYWNWQNEYGARVRPVGHVPPFDCPTCGAMAKCKKLADCAEPSLERTLCECAYCGIIADLPAGPVRLQIDGSSLSCSASTLEGRALLWNDGDRAHRITVGVAIERAGQMRPDSARKAELVLEPGSRLEFEFSLTAVEPMSDLMQTRVYFASEGAFGLVSTNLLYGRG